jgi:hypothetical protein
LPAFRFTRKLAVIKNFLAAKEGDLDRACKHLTSVRRNGMAVLQPGCVYLKRCIRIEDDQIGVVAHADRALLVIE